MGKSNYNKFVSTKEEKPNTKVVSCMNCLLAKLIQYGMNPVLAECMKKPNIDNDRFPYERQVASARWICPDWKEDVDEKTIEHREIKAA